MICTLIKKITTTFDFGKLASKIPEILDDLVEESKMVYAEMSVKNITEGLRPLKKPSIDARKKGHYWGNKKVTPTSKTKPLDYTGDLIKSIKIHKQGIIMNEYGLHHQRGFTLPQGTRVPPRKFLAMNLDAKNITGKYKETQKKFIKNMYKKIGKALKK